jgi:hypothetical protein
MRKNLQSLAIIAGGLLLSSAAAWAHHAFSAEFDENKKVMLRGRVTQMEWINPHVWIHLDVKGPDGAVASWMIEGGPPNALLKRGWNKHSLPEGTEIVVEGYQSKDGALRANGREITLTDGSKLFVGSSGAGEKPSNEK